MTATCCVLRLERGHWLLPADELQTHVRLHHGRLVLDPPIASVAKYRCFVFQVFQGGLASELAAVVPVGYGRSPMRLVKHSSHEAQCPRPRTRSCGDPNSPVSRSREAFARPCHPYFTVARRSLCVQPGN